MIRDATNMKTVYIFVNGIKTFPGQSKNWNGRAVTATHARFGGKSCVVAEKVEYYTTALTRSLLQKHRAEKLVKVCSFYRDWNRVLVGHSNGADVILDALHMDHTIRVSRLHLISPAVDWDCHKNGLNGFYRDGQITYPPSIWVAGKDKALRLGGSFFGKLLGYGALGLKGPKPGTLLAQAGYCEPNFGHSDWFNDENFNKTMERIWTS